MSDANAAPASPAAPSPESTPEPAAPAEGTPTPAEPAEGAKPAEPAAPAEAPAPLLAGESDQGGTDKGKPEQSDPGAEIKMSFPEGVEVDQAMVDRFLPLAKKAGLTSETASELGAWFAEEQKAANKAHEETWNQTSDAWRKEIENDPDYGRDKFEESTARAKRGVEWAGEKVQTFIDEYGLGNHPDIYRFFARLGKAVGDDNILVSGGAGGGSGKITAEERRAKMYPTMNEDGTPKDGGRSS